jgi:hypothetical protein
LVRKARCGCPTQLEVASDLGDRAPIEPLQNPFTFLRAEPVQELAGADSSRLDPAVLLLQHRRHRLGEVAAIGNAYRSPFVRPANRALLPPPPCDDEEMIPAEDRPCMLAARPDVITPSPPHWRPSPFDGGKTASLELQALRDGG